MTMPVRSASGDQYRADFFAMTGARQTAMHPTHKPMAGSRSEETRRGEEKTEKTPDTDDRKNALPGRFLDVLA